MIGHVLKGCYTTNPNTDEEDLQHRDWLRALPLKSHRRNAEAEIKEETKLYLAFRKSRKRSEACQKLSFVDDQRSTREPPAGVASRNSHDAGSSEMVMNEESEFILGNKASKYKFEDTVTSRDVELRTMRPKLHLLL